MSEPRGKSESALIARAARARGREEASGDKSVRGGLASTLPFSYEKRGWCLVEKGASTVVAAHLAHAAKSERGLLDRFKRAEAARPKVD